MAVALRGRLFVVFRFSCVFFLSIGLLLLPGCGKSDVQIGLGAGVSASFSSATVVLGGRQRRDGGNGRNRGGDARPAGRDRLPGADGGFRLLVRLHRSRDLPAVVLEARGSRLERQQLAETTSGAKAQQTRKAVMSTLKG